MNDKSLLSAFLTTILIGGLILASAVRFGAAQASTDVSGLPKPSVPEFTVELVDRSYDVPTTYSTDPYTGETRTHGGYRVENRTIDITIKNQPFTSYRNENDSLVGLYYNIRVKGHFEQEWRELYSSPNHLYRSDSEYTVKSYVLGKSDQWDFPPGGQVDFQVEALLGYNTKISEGWTYMGESYHLIFTGESSGWSDTQTLAIPATPEQGNAILGVVIVVMVVLGAALGLLIYLIKRK